MITEQELREAIAECVGTRNPNASTCLKLASFYTILDHMNKTEEKIIPTYSFAEPKYQSDTEFSKLSEGMSEYEFRKLVDELMDTLQVLNPRLYNAVLEKMR